MDPCVHVGRRKRLRNQEVLGNGALPGKQSSCSSKALRATSAIEAASSDKFDDDVRMEIRRFPSEIQKARVLGERTGCEDIAVMTFGTKTTEVIGGLAVSLGDARPDVRDAALDGLELLGRGSSPIACASVVTLLGHKNWSVRLCAMLALARIAPWSDNDAMRAIVACLDANSVGVREQVPGALETLLEGVRGLPEVVEALQQRLESPKWVVRQPAINAIARLGEKNDRATVTMITKALHDDNTKVREQVVDAMDQLMSDESFREQNSMDFLYQGIESRDPSIRGTAITAIGRLVPRGSLVARKVLEHHIEDPHWPLRAKAVIALSHVASPDSVVIAMIGKMLEDAIDVVRAEAIVALVTLARSMDDPGLVLVEARKRANHAGHGVKRAATLVIRKLESLSDIVNHETADNNGSDCAMKSRDAIASELAQFLLEAKKEEVAADSADDPVARGLRNFLAEQRRQSGPRSCLAPSCTAKAEINQPALDDGD